MVSYFQKRPHFLILGFILLIGLFFRTYQIVERFEFAHDGDLYSWIVKDITINHHSRLIGQLTSAPGIFVGPLFYYLLVPFFILTNMDPIGALIPITLIGILTIFSYYFVLSKLFNKTIGLIAAFLYAVLITTVNADRWVVPTVTTSIWAIWYFYTLVMMSRGNFFVLPLLGILVGLIWHIHIALLPALIAVPISLLISRKLPDRKNTILFVIILLISSLPFLLFETRHNFSQSKSFLNNFSSSFNTEKEVSASIIYYFSKDVKSIPTGSKTLVIDLTTGNLDQVYVHIYSNNSKFNTLKINLGCGNPSKYEIGSSDAKFNWSIKGCGDKQLIEVNGRVRIDPIWWKIYSSFSVVLEKLTKNVSDLFLTPLSLTKSQQLIFTLIISFSSIFIVDKKRLLSFKQSLPLVGWVISLLLFFTFSSIAISEYYLASLNVLYITIISFVFFKIYKFKRFGKYLFFALLTLILINTFFFFAKNEPYKKGYLERKAVVEYIKNDASLKQFPCIGISYITALGENVGFRYFFYLNNVHLVRPSTEVPVYNIVIPDELSLGEVTQKFGHIGIIPPTSVPSKEVIEKSCQTPDTNLTDPVLGYVD